MAISPSPKMFKVRNAEGHIFDIPEEKLDEALARDERNQLVQDQEVFAQNTPDNDDVFIKDASGIVKIPRSRLPEAQERGGILIEEKDIPKHPEEPDNWGKFLARSAKTIASEVVGSIPDTATSLYNIPALAENTKTPEQKQNSPSQFAPESFVPEVPVYPDQQLPLIPSVAGKIEHEIDEATGGYTKTEEGDVFQAGLKTATAVATPGGLAKLGKNALTKTLGALGTTNPIGVASAGAAGAVTQKAVNEGYNPVVAGALGLALGAGTGLAGSALKFDKKLALATLTGNSPKNINLEAVKAFEKAGLPYSNTTVNESRGLALIDQLISKTPHYGTKQAQTLKANDKAYEIALDESISKVGAKIIESENPSQLDIGHAIQEVFEGTQDIIKDMGSDLYDIQRAILPKNAETMPHFLSQHSKEIKETIKTLRASTDEAFLLKYVDDLEKSIFAIEEIQASKLTLAHDLELKFVPNQAKGKKTLKEIPVELLVGTKRSLNDIINWDINATGVKNQLKHLQRATKKDIEAYGKTNPEWYEAFKKADKFHGEKRGDEALGNKAIRKKIFAQQNPEKILDSLNDISDFKAMEQSLNVTEKGANFFDSIKRQKLTDLIMGKTINSNKESVNFSGFSKVMEGRKTRELVKYLAGDTYQDLHKFLSVAKAAIQRNARIPNPSGTAPTNTVINSILGSMTGAGGMVAGIKATGGALGATMAGAYALNWFVTNKTALKWGIEAAKKQAAGDIKGATVLSSRIERSMAKDLGEDFVRQFIAISQDEDVDQKQG